MRKSLKLTCLFFLTLFSFSSNASLLSNPGFESGLTYWESSGGAAIRSNDDPSAYEGQNYLYGFDTPLFSVWQDVDLINKGFLPSEIDSGNFIVELGGWQSGWHSQQDSGQIHVRFFDTTMSQIGTTALPSFYSNNTWEEQSGLTNLLAGTRFIRYEFIGTRVGSGSNNDAYLDAAYLNVAAIPVPAAVWLFGSGLVGLIGIRGKLPPNGGSVHSAC
ncbi:hypothetical protein [Methylotuvimicrobium sp.]|uniref:hypothetical protein n=1 Tax=Methylotuvimicrobium sp. TaxID=2822413 RepID=UPI003D64FB54